MNPQVEARFWSKVRANANGCWVWIAGKDKDGYGQFHIPTNGTPRQICRRSMRVAYELMIGEIPKELVLVCKQCIFDRQRVRRGLQ